MAWLAHGNPWEFARPEITYRVRFGGRVVKEGDVYHWVDSHDVQAMAYDTIIPGYDTMATNTLRLWSAKATQEIENPEDWLIASCLEGYARALKAVGAPEFGAALDTALKAIDAIEDPADRELLAGQIADLL